MKREILLGENHSAPQLWGYAGEKAHSRITVLLPDDVADCDYCQAMVSVKNNLYPTERLKISNKAVSFMLTESTTKQNGAISVQVVGYVVDESGTAVEIAKTQIYKGTIQRSSEGVLDTSPEAENFWQKCWTKLNALVEKAHTHLNKPVLDKLGETNNGKLMFDGEEISAGGIQPVAEFPNNPKDGDVALLYRCNEITADDSYSNIIPDISAIASLTLPEGYTDRIWTFTALNNNGQDFVMRIHVSLNETPEGNYVLTNLTISSEELYGNWYWRDGELATDIPVASAEPVPTSVVLGNVDSFMVVKTLSDIRGDIEDTYDTVVFRTHPLYYVFLNNGWGLINRDRIAEGAIIGSVETVERSGQKYLRLNLTDAHRLHLDKSPNYIDIPVSGVKDVEEKPSPGLTLNGSEIMFPTGGGTGGIKAVTALPDFANDGDVVFYCPQPNTLTAADSHQKAYINFEEAERLFEWYLENGKPNEPTFDIYYNSLESIGWGWTDESKVLEVSWVKDGEPTDYIANAWKLESGETHRYASTYFNNDYAAYNKHFPYFNIGEVDEDVMRANSNRPAELEQFHIFYTEPRFYRYVNGAWVEILTPEAEVNTDDIWSAIDEIRGGIDEIETLIDESGVLE